MWKLSTLQKKKNRRKSWSGEVDFCSEVQHTVSHCGFFQNATVVTLKKV